MLKLQLALPADGGACILLVHNHNQDWGSSHVTFGQGGRGDWEWDGARGGGVFTVEPLICSHAPFILLQATIVRLLSHLH